MEPALDEAWELPASPPQGGELPRVEDQPDPAPSHDPAPERRGRPAGILLVPRLRQLRDRVLAAAGALPAAAAAAPEFQGDRDEPEALPPEEECLMRYCEPTLGPPQQQLVAKAIADGPGVEMEDVDLVEHYFGEAPRIGGPSSGEARALGLAESNLRRRTQRMAAMVHWGTRGWVSALCLRLMREIEGGQVEPIACGNYCLGDETPLPLRAQVLEERGDVERGHTTQLASRAHDRAGG